VVVAVFASLQAAASQLKVDTATPRGFLPTAPAATEEAMERAVASRVRVARSPSLSQRVEECPHWTQPPLEREIVRPP
jgi:hypothetical protein